MIFPPGLNVDDKNLLEPVCQLNQIVPLEKPRHISSGPVGPDLGIVKPVCGVIPEMLISISTRPNFHSFLGHLGDTYHTQSPEDTII
jgi:hypothetical protein